MTPSQIEDKLIAANMAYAKGMPFMTDIEYDKLWQELRKFKPDSPILYHTAHNTEDQDEVPHKRPIRGTNKAFTTTELKPFMMRYGSNELIFEPKYDGCAAVLYAGKETYSSRLILEGDGIAGRDISHHIPNLFFSFMPKHFESVELIIPTPGWDKSFGSNPRNTIAGWLARKELPYVNLVQAISHNYGELNNTYTFDGNYDKLEERLLYLHNKWSKLYPIDGIMIKVKDEKKRIISGDNGTTFNWSIAWKPPIQTKETTVVDIEWNVSRTGRVIPTVIYEPIELCGTINSRATGNNAKWIESHKLQIGNKIIVGKAGEIIPKILASENESLDIIYNDHLFYCPVCDSQLELVGVDLICNDLDCIAKLNKRLEYFYSDKGMEVKTIGEYRIADLLQNETIRQTLIDKPWALLDPIHYNINEEIRKIWGQKHTLNYLTALMKVKGKKNAIHFIAALGFSKLAYKTSLKLFYYIKNGTKVSNISKEAQGNFVIAFATFTQAEKEMMNFNFDLVPAEPKITYCITGTLSSSRQDMVKYLEKYGWSFSNQVSKFIDFLIIGDSPGKIKITKARELNIMTINENDLNNYLK